MDQICLALPVLVGQSPAARAFLRALDADRRAHYDRFERRLGISKEAWYLAALPSGDHLIAYMESADFHRALGRFVASQDDCDLWFKQHLAAVTGLDLNNPPPDMALPELLSRYQWIVRHVWSVQDLPERPVRADCRRQCLWIGQKLQRRNLRHTSWVRQRTLFWARGLL